MPIVSTLQGILLSVLPVFTQPSGQVFLRLVVGWVLCPTRRTVTGTIPYADPDGLRSHDTYHRFFRAAAWCRDAVRSTRQRTVHVWGLKIVPLCLRVVPPWGGEPLALPIAFRLYRKGSPTLLDLVEEMVNDVAAWLPDRTFTLTAAGGTSPALCLSPASTSRRGRAHAMWMHLAPFLPPRCELTTRRSGVKSLT